MNRKPIKLVIIGLFLAVIAVLLQRAPTGSQGDPKSHAKISPQELAFLNAFRQPINLFGKVVDQHGNPIEGATIEVYANDKPFSDGGPPDVTLVSDISGSFSVVGLKGVALGVLAKKKGYIHYSPVGGPTSSANVTSSKYANATHPLILTLHDPGELEPLVHLGQKNWALPSDGTPCEIALDSKDGNGGSHVIEFKFITKRFLLPEDQLYTKQYDWSFEAVIPGGGFARNQNDLDMKSYYQFEAPVDGYVEKIRYDFPSNLSKEQWTNFAMDSFFVRFPDGTHGRIRFTIHGLSNRKPLLMETWFNPKPGSRNLSSLYK